MAAICVELPAQHGGGGDQDKSSVPTELTIYPNPAVEYFTINAEVAVKRITINNIVGKQMLDLQSNADNRYDVSDLKKGIYVVRVFDQNDQLLKALRLSKS